MENESVPIADYGLDDSWFKSLGLDMGEGEGGDGDSGKVPDGLSLEKELAVQVDCATESEQETLYNEMIERGFTCRILKL